MKNYTTQLEIIHIYNTIGNKQRLSIQTCIKQLNDTNGNLFNTTKYNEYN